MPLVYSQIVEVSRADARKSLVSLLDAIGFQASTWTEGRIPLALVEIGAEIWSRCSAYAVYLKNAGFSETSVGDGLTRFSKSHYDNVRFAATKAQRLITLTCAVGEGPHTINFQSVAVGDAEVHIFRNIGPLASYPTVLKSGGATTFLFEAEEAGAVSNALAGEVTQLVTTLSGVTVTEDIPHQNGVNEESDQRLRLRNSTKWSTLSFEVTEDTAINVMLNAHPAIAKVKVDATNPHGPGTVDIYVAGETTTFEDSSTEVARAYEKIRKRVFGSRTIVRVLGAHPLLLNLAGVVYFDPKFTGAEVRVAVETALVEFLKTVPINGFSFSPGPNHIVPKNNIEDAIVDSKIDGETCVKLVELTTPVADIAVGAWEALVQGDWSGLTYVPTSG